MVSRDFQTLALRRAERARLLAETHEPPREVLAFLTGVYAWQSQLADASPADRFPSLLDWVRAKGPGPLRAAADELDQDRLPQVTNAYLAGDQDTPESFFARIVLQPEAASRPIPDHPENMTVCPRCGEPPQGGVLRPLAHGNELSLFCSLCLAEWLFPRTTCPQCGESDPKKLGYHATEDLPHLETMTCKECETYLHLIDLGKDPRALPDVDEILAMPLDVWAIEQGFKKLHPNLAGL